MTISSFSVYGAVINVGMSFSRTICILISLALSVVLPDGVDVTSTLVSISRGQSF